MFAWAKEYKVWGNTWVVPEAAQWSRNIERHCKYTMSNKDCHWRLRKGNTNALRGSSRQHTAKKIIYWPRGKKKVTALKNDVYFKMFCCLYWLAKRRNTIIENYIFVDHFRADGCPGNDIFWNTIRTFSLENASTYGKENNSEPCQQHKEIELLCHTYRWQIFREVSWCR